MVVKVQKLSNPKKLWKFATNLLKSFMYAMFTTRKHQVIVQGQWIAYSQEAQKTTYHIFFFTG